MLSLICHEVKFMHDLNYHTYLTLHNYTVYCIIIKKIILMTTIFIKLLNAITESTEVFFLF